MKQSFPLDSVSLDRSLAVPLHRQLYGHLREMIEDTSIPKNIRKAVQDLTTRESKAED